MSQNNNDTFNVFDPTGMLKNMRDENMNAWAKMMTEYVNTDAYAEATGAMLDTWLSSSSPFQKVLQSNMEKALANLQMPTRTEITRLASRLTNLEMRLDDLDAKLDDVLAASRKPVTTCKKAKSSRSEDE